MTTNTTDDAPIVKLSLHEVEKRWKEQCALVIGFEMQMLRLVAHPETTPEQLQVAREKYVQLLQRMKDACLKLEDKYPKAARKRGLAFLQRYWSFTSLNGIEYTCDVKRRRP